MSGKKRGLSLEDKRGKVMQIFHESMDVFLFKDVEKLAVKKGVTFQSVKEVVQSLVDDDMVHQDKIGISNFLWAFPSETSSKVVAGLKASLCKAEGAKKRCVELAAGVEEANAARTETTECNARQKVLEGMKQQLPKLWEEVEHLSSSDAARFHKMAAAIPLARVSANICQDNIYTTKDWIKKKFQGRETEVEKFFVENGLTDDVDYVE
mmetsp:Transcript_7206/g.18269  ORF Transcript_7206/g.18269 Transcript_7206/m.18269 type:complete len:209 (-) Transcript_7206:50-676(-)